MSVLAKEQLKSLLAVPGKIWQTEDVVNLIDSLLGVGEVAQIDPMIVANEIIQNPNFKLSQDKINGLIDGLADKISESQLQEVNNSLLDQIGSIRVGVPPWTTSDTMIAPTIDFKAVSEDNPVVALSLNVINSGTYSNLKLASGATAPTIIITDSEVKEPFVFLVYDKNEDKWSKQVKVDFGRAIAIMYNYDVVADPNGWVVRLESKTSISEIIISNNVYAQSYIEVDSSGYVRNGTNWKNESLNYSNVTLIVPSLFSGEIDKFGYAITIIKSASTPIKESLPDKVSDLFTEPVTISSSSMHLAFPGICSNRQILYAFYRKAQYHTGDDGGVYYKLSKDYGKIWSNEQLLLSGGEPHPDDINYKSDWRDCKAIRMSNGKILLSQTKHYATPTEGTPPYHVSYDSNKCRTFGIIYNVLSDGTLDINNATQVEIPLQNGMDWLFGAGGLMERDKIIYLTAYHNSTNTHGCSLFRSLDFGLTWEFVSGIADGYNENSIAFINEVMFCTARSADQSSAGVARIMKSTDYGVTWNIVKNLDTFMHGMYMLGLGDTILLAGRIAAAVAIIFLKRSGDSAIDLIRVAASGDAAYCDICTCENYVHLIWYNNPTGGYEIKTMKIERNKVIGLSY